MRRRWGPAAAAHLASRAGIAHVMAMRPRTLPVTVTAHRPGSATPAAPAAQTPAAAAPSSAPTRPKARPSAAAWRSPFDHFKDTSTWTN